MSNKLEELIELWGKALRDGELQPKDQAHFDELMADPHAVESFSQWQASMAGAENAQALSEAQWGRVDARVKKAYHGMLKPLWTRPWFWGLAAIPLACGIGASFYLVKSGPAEEPPATTRVDARPFPFRVLEGHRHRPHHARPRPRPSQAEPAARLAPAPQVEAPHVADKRMKARRIKVAVELPTEGNVQVTVRGQEGRAVASLYSGPLRAGKWRFEWDGVDDNGRAVLPGRYKVEVRSASGAQEQEIEVSRK